MKNKILALALLLTTFLSFGQHNKESREKIKALKVAYLTQELKLNAIEAQQFWPLYHKHKEKIDNYQEKNRSKFRSTAVYTPGCVCTHTLNLVPRYRRYILLVLQLCTQL